MHQLYCLFQFIKLLNEFGYFVFGVQASRSKTYAIVDDFCSFVRRQSAGSWSPNQRSSALRLSIKTWPWLRCSKWRWHWISQSTLDSACWRCRNGLCTISTTVTWARCFQTSSSFSSPTQVYYFAVNYFLIGFDDLCYSET